MSEGAPRASRPYMPGYGTAGPDEGGGLLPWSWAEDKLARARNFWVATVGDESQPHLTPVWGVWHDERLWFTCSVKSRKARNLRRNPLCTICTEDASDPVVLEGIADLVTDPDEIAAFRDPYNTKYRTNIELDWFDPSRTASFRLRARWAFGLEHDNFQGSPTRWIL